MFVPGGRPFLRTALSQPGVEIFLMADAKVVKQIRRRSVKHQTSLKEDDYRIVDVEMLQTVGDV